jgi:hypothetical protein
MHINRCSLVTECEKGFIPPLKKKYINKQISYYFIVLFIKKTRHHAPLFQKYI